MSKRPPAAKGANTKGKGSSPVDDKDGKNGELMLVVLLLLFFHGSSGLIGDVLG